MISKEYIKTQKVINAQDFNIQSEPLAPKEIVVENKIRTHVFFLEEQELV